MSKEKSNIVVNEIFSIKCCSKELKTRFCPHCGKENSMYYHPLMGLLLHTETQIKKLCKNKERNKHALIKWASWAAVLKRVIKEETKEMLEKYEERKHNRQ